MVANTEAERESHSLHVGVVLDGVAPRTGEGASSLAPIVQLVEHRFRKPKDRVQVPVGAR